MALLTLKTRKLKSIKVQATRGYASVKKLEHNLRGFGIWHENYVVHKRPKDGKFTALFQGYDMSTDTIQKIERARFYVL